MLPLTRNVSAERRAEQAEGWGGAAPWGHGLVALKSHHLPGEP